MSKSSVVIPILFHEINRFFPGIAMHNSCRWNFDISFCLGEIAMFHVTSKIDTLTMVFLSTTSQIAETFGSTSIRHLSDMKVSGGCIIDVNPRAFAVWDNKTHLKYMQTVDTWFSLRFANGRCYLSTSRLLYWATRRISLCKKSTPRTILPTRVNKANWNLNIDK